MFGCGGVLLSEGGEGGYAEDPEEECSVCRVQGRERGTGVFNSPESDEFQVGH